MKQILLFARQEIVLLISLLLAIISIIIVPPCKAYWEYIDVRTLSILLGMMLIMAGLQHLNFFQQLGETLVDKMRGIRGVSFLLVALCFCLSMFITNDVALLTFVPFTVIVFHMANRDDLLIPVIVLQTVAANLGSMLMPMGNPQNLYLHNLSRMSIPDFVLLMLPFAIVSLVLLCIILIILIKNEEVSLQVKHDFHRSKKKKIKLVSYLMLFVLFLLVVARLVPYGIGISVVVLFVLVFDRAIFLKVDYSLIFTFVFLFIFIGNMKQIHKVSEMLFGLTKGNEIAVSVVSSQVISNVPAAILLSGFTDNTKALIIGTNIGGLGTIIASMASLISFKIYAMTTGADKKKYMICFTGINILFLVALCALKSLL